MKIEIFGKGCAKCERTEAIITETVKRLGIDAEIVHVLDLNEIVGRGVMVTPAVAVDGVLKISGRIPSESMVRQWLSK